MPAGAVLFPGIAGVASITLFLAPNRLANTPMEAYGYGTAIAVVGWFLLPTLIRRYAYVDRSNPNAYAQLVEAYSALRIQAGCIARGPENVCELDEACEHIAYVGRELGLYENGTEPSSGLRWLLATGYVDLWRRVHRAEEALLLAESPERVIGEAVYDDLCLDGSKIGAANHLRVKLRAAVFLLGNGAEKFLNPAPSGLAQLDVTTSPPNDRAARNVLRSLRRSINEYRDDRREGLVRARNNLYGTAGLAGLVAHLVLGLALVSSPTDPKILKSAILAAAAFYLVGALIGLFRQLWAASAAGEAAKEDFGLSTARLIHTPLLSGIAAVAGAALVRVLPLTLPETSDDKTKISLPFVFDLANWPEGLLYAALFGFAPTLLIKTLQRRAEQYKEDLKTSEPSERAAGTW